MDVEARVNPAYGRIELKNANRKNEQEAQRATCRNKNALEGRADSATELAGVRTGVL
jgi:hypothetical protein